MRWVRRAALIGFGLALALVALEVVLQVGAFVQWRRAAGIATGTDGGMVVGDDVILCVGDSFTYGLGAADFANAYPRALQRALRDADTRHAVDVVNAGFPGRNSREVLDALPRQLAICRPRTVCVLVGYNDFWSERDAVDGFGFELRTLRLARMMIHALSGTLQQVGEQESGVSPQVGNDPATAPFLGSWYIGDHWFAFRRDRRIDTSAGPMPVIWSHDDTHLTLTHTATEQVDRVEWQLEDGALTLRGGPFGTGLRLANAPPADAPLLVGHAAEEMGDVVAAERAYRSAFDDPVRGADARAACVALLVATDRVDAARELVAELEGGHVAAPTGASALRLARARVLLGDVDRAVALALQSIADGADDPRLVELVTHHAGRVQDPIAVESGVRRALARTGLPDPLAIGLWGLLFKLVEDRDVAGAVMALVEVARLDREGDLLELAVARRGDQLDLAALRGAIEVRIDDPAERAALLARLDRALARDDRTVDGLAGNLRQVVATCRNAGAMPLLLTYPIRRDDVTAAVRLVAEQTGADWIDLRQEFADRVPAVELPALFVLDGHCNDRGYVLMGQIVAEHLGPH